MVECRSLQGMSRYRQPGISVSVRLHGSTSSLEGRELGPAAGLAVLAGEEAPKLRRHEFRLARVVGCGVPDSRKRDPARTRQHRGASNDRRLEALVDPLTSAT